MQHFFDYSPKVLKAKAEKKPILALESTIITHGLPKPINFELAKELEEIVASYNVTPATIAILNGKIKIGLMDDELQQLAMDASAMKASRRDIAYIVSHAFSAGTTVAATLFCANAAGISVFATGGIGGVHRGEAQDISADLIELARTPVAVICAGAKAILDLAKTLEFLETYSVPIVGYKTDKLPAFYSVDSNHALPMQVQDVAKLAHMVKTHWQLGNESGILITNPIPEEHEIPANKIEPFIVDALQKANQLNIASKEITPFLLSELATLTDGNSVKSNMALIKHNVRLGAELARAL